MFTTLKCRSALISIVCCFCLGSIAFAADPQRLEIPAGELSVALQTLTKQTGIELVYQTESIKGVKTKGVSGTLSPVDALTKLLEGTGLKVNTDSTGAMLIAAPQGTRGSSNRVALADPTSTRLAQSNTTNSQSQPAYSGSLNSQDIPAKPTSIEESNGAIAEILVRGSRINNVDIKRTEDDAQPYTIFDSEAIEQSGAVSVEDFLKQQLTMNTTVQSHGQAYGGAQGATSSINLRGLGTNETLILIDGRRAAGVYFVGADSASQPDINGIPLAAVERIEVLPSSASAIYGGAALGGVVNIVLKKRYDGGEISYSYENTTATNAPLNALNASYGLSLEGGKTHVMISGEYSDGTAVLERDRPELIQRGISTILQNEPSFLYSPFSPFQGATTNIASADGSNLILKGGQPINASITHIAPGTAPGASLAASLLANAGTYDLALNPGTGPNGLQTPIVLAPTTKSLMVSIRREMTPWLDVFTDFRTSSNSTRTLFNQLNYYDWNIPAGAATNPFEQDVLVAVPSAISDPLTANSVTQSLTTGIVIRLPKGWSTEIDYTWSRNSFELVTPGLLYTAISSAFASGTLNPFVDTLAHPLDLSQFYSNDYYAGASTLNDVGLRASGPLWSFPWGQPSLTLGVEHRKEGTDDADDSFLPQTDPADQNVTRYFGQSQSTNSIYLEALVPLVTAKNAVPFVRSLDLQLAGRSEWYTVHAGTPYAFIYPASNAQFDPPQGVRSEIKYSSTNPTIGFKYKPIEIVTFRASYAKAFLPPTPNQLLANPVSLSGGSGTTQNILDPVSGQTYGVLTEGGGNPRLKPQTSRNWDFGIIVEPQDELLKGLRLNLEYYNIKQPDYITFPTAQDVVSDPALAGRLTRDPNTGRITLVDTSYINASEYKTAGWDLAVDYRKATAIGTVGLRALGTMIAHDDRQYAIGSPFLNYVGFPAEGGETKWKANLSLSWDFRSWTVAWFTTYFGGYGQVLSLGSPVDVRLGLKGAYTRYTAAQGASTVPSQIYHDILVKYSFGAIGVGRSGGIAGNALSNLSLQLRMKNVFDSLPPLDVAFPPYYYSPYGDPRLRSYQLTLKKEF